MARSCGLDESAAALHGRVLALISNCDGDCADPAGVLLADLSEAPLRAALDRLYRETRQALEGPGLAFEMLLPPGDEPLPLQAQALIDWAHGFLDQLERLGVDVGKRLDVAGQSAIGDIRALAWASAGQFAGSQDQVHEASELLWVASVLVCELLIIDRQRR